MRKRGKCELAARLELTGSVVCPSAFFLLRWSAVVAALGEFVGESRSFSVILKSRRWDEGVHQAGPEVAFRRNELRPRLSPFSAALSAGTPTTFINATELTFNFTFCRVQERPSSCSSQSVERVSPTHPVVPKPTPPSTRMSTRPSCCTFRSRSVFPCSCARGHSSESVEGCL